MGRGMILKRGAERLASRLGYTVVPNWRMKGRPLSRHMRHMFELYEIDCVLDIGANKGQFGQFVRQEVEYGGQILSFEPVTHNYAELEKKCQADQSWKCFPIALG